MRMVSKILILLWCHFWAPTSFAQGNDCADEPFYHSILQKIRNEFSNEFEQANRPLTLVEEWNSSVGEMLMDSAVGFDFKVTIRTTGDYVRNNHLSKDALTLALCHEVGHTLGGEPKINYPPNNLIFVFGSPTA